MRALADRKEVYEEIARIFIVNQGDRFGLSDLVTDASEDFLGRIELIEQDNLGGCGGFTRGMYETLRDAVPDAFHPARRRRPAAPRVAVPGDRFMRYANDDVVIGGHMLDLARPDELYEAGADFDPETLLPKPVGQGEELSDPDTLEMFLEVRPVDYNGWWFFAAATSVLEDLGLPIPCFIRGDDMEYGARLKRHGLKTIPVPGIAVWHEPFYLKLGNWHYYFEIRNRLTMLSLHRNGDLKAVRRKIRRKFHFDAMLSRYNTCQFAIDALRDYLAGGDAVFDTTNRALLRCLEHQKAIGPKRVDGRAKASVIAVRQLPPARLHLVDPDHAARPARAAGLVAPSERVACRAATSSVPWRPLVFDRYRVIGPVRPVAVGVRAQPEARTPAARRVRTADPQLRSTFGDDVVDRSAGTPWLGWWRRQFDGNVITDPK